MYPVAYVALLTFILLGFMAVRSAPPESRTFRVALVYLTGQMFLPNRVGFDLPVLPSLGKEALSSLVPLLALATSGPAGTVAWRMLFTGPAVFLWLSIAAYLGTKMTNADALVFGPKRITSLSLRDVLAFGLGYFASTGTAFVLGRACVRSPEQLKQVARAIVTMALIQLPICLIELRMSPQIHRWIYGFTVIGFGNIRRGDGYKPVGFLQGGLAMAIFLYASVASALALSHIGEKVGRFQAKRLLLAIWAVLAVSKNLGANVFGLLTYVVTRFLGWRLALRLASLLVLGAWLYPYVRSGGFVNVYALTDWIAERSPDRAASLAFRFVNEDQMLARALERPFFGWGGYGRSRIYNEQGQDMSVQDGAWIISLGMQGIIGLIGLFGLIGTPVLGWGKRLAKATLEQRKLISGIVFLQALLLVDLLPNGYFLTLPAFVAGTLTGLREGRWS